MFGPDLPNLMKFIQILLQKILRKIRQPLGALRGHLTKSQPQENFSSCQIISSNTCWTLCCQVQITVSETTVVFFSVRSQSRQCPGVALLPVPSPLFLRRTIPWNLADVGDEQQEVRRPVTDASGGFAAVRREAQRRRRHPAPPKPPELAPWPSTPQNALPLSS